MSSPTSTSTSTGKEYLLHFVGSRIYNKKRFINEAKRIEAQRAIHWSQLLGIKWGQPVLLGEYRSVERQCPECNGGGGDEPRYRECAGCNGYGVVKVPVADVFGYMSVSGISYQLPREVELLVAQKLDIEHVAPPPAGGYSETRACGSYGVGPIAYVRNSLEEIVAIINEAARQFGYNPVKFKYFIRSSVNVLPAPIVLEPCKFQRGYKKVYIPINVQQEPPKKALFALYDYSAKTYRKKAELDAMDGILLDEFIDETT